MNTETTKMYTVSVQNFQGEWANVQFQTKDEVFAYVTSLDIVQAVEVDDVDVMDFDALNEWMNK